MLFNWCILCGFTEDWSLSSFHMILDALTRDFTPLLILPQTSHSINLIHDYNFMLNSLGSSSKSMKLQVVLRSLMLSINHWLPQVEGFLGVHLTTDQECSGKSSSIHHYTYRTNQRHKEMCILGMWKLVSSNFLCDIQLLSLLLM